MNSEIAIKVEGLTKIYPIYNSKKDRMKEALSFTRIKYHKDFYALNNVSFEIAKGETLGIIGQNGSGKSTLLKILTGVLTATIGTVIVNGKVSALLELGAGFNLEMTGMENIYLNGTIMGYTKKEMDERVAKIIEFADIGDFMEQPVKMYSSGMFARLAFAVAINVEPDILIIDEALSVGDIFFQNKCFRKLEELRNSGITILFVSHDLVSIKQLCTRVLWIEKGEQRAFGNKETICTLYHNEQLKENMSLYDSHIEGTTKIKAETQNEVKTYPMVKVNSKDVMSNEVEIKSFFLEDSQGLITERLKTNNCYKAHILCENKADLENAIFGINLENNRGISIASFNTYANNSKSNIVLKSGVVTEVILEFVLPKLQKGEYLMSVAVAEGVQENHRNLTWLYNSLCVFIENEGYNLSLYEFDVSVKVLNLEQGKVRFV